MLDDSILEDPEQLAEVDTDGLLRQIATAGAQVRSMAETMREHGRLDVDEDRPRALVFLARPGAGHAVPALLAALLGPSCPVPVVVASAVPAWVGPLDVVLACSDDPGDAVLAESLALAGNRGARVYLMASDEGPVAAAAAGRATRLHPRMEVPPGLGFTSAYAASVSVLCALGLLGPPAEAEPGATGLLDVLADELDSEAGRDHPSFESLVNPAKALALRLAEHTPLLWGVDDPGVAVANYAAQTLARFAGVPAVPGEYARARGFGQLFRQIAAGEETDLFADPEDVPAGRPRAFLLAAGPGDQEQRRQATTALPDANVVEPEAAPEDAVLRAGLLAQRFDFAAVYLGLAAGTVGGAGRHAAVSN